MYIVPKLTWEYAVAYCAARRGLAPGAAGLLAEAAAAMPDIWALKCCCIFLIARSLSVSANFTTMLDEAPWNKFSSFKSTQILDEKPIKNRISLELNNKTKL